MQISKIIAIDGPAASGKSTVSKAALDFDTISLVAEESKSLYAHCLHFIANLRLSKFEFIIAQRILEELEPTGWLSDDLERVAKELKCEMVQVEEVLSSFKKLNQQDYLPAA